MSRELLLIGLTAAAGSGKDTVAGYLEARHGFLPVALAEPLLDMLGELLRHAEVDGAWMVERSLKEQPMPGLGVSYRHLAQTLGTEWGRKLVAQGLWTGIATRKVQQALRCGDPVVVTDIRFPDEAHWLRALGGRLVRVERGAAPLVRAHESEAHHATLAADFTLANDSSLGALEHRVDAMVAWLARDHTLKGLPA